MKKKTNYKSSCCRTRVKFSDPSPDFIGDDPKIMKIGTCYVICTKCGKACDIYVPIRKTWTRNPKTQIIPNKKKQITEKLTRKEIEKFRKEEDF